MINYSIIIPHKNIPDLLQKCLDSIPLREDIQIIIVDDNSDPKIVDFENFPGLNCPYTEVYFTKEGKGAGYARNVGIDHAVGKWLIFADADDYFNSSFNEALDVFIIDDSDIVFFKTNSIFLNDNTISTRGKYINDRIDIAKKDQNYDLLLYATPPPWAKFIRKEIIDSNKIYFKESLWANDVHFSTMVGMKVRNIKISDLTIYCITLRYGSLETSITVEALTVRFINSCETYHMLEKINKHSLVFDSAFFWWKEIFLLKKFHAIVLLPKLLKIYDIKYIFQTINELFGIQLKRYLKKLKLTYPRTWNFIKMIK